MVDDSNNFDDGLINVLTYVSKDVAKLVLTSFASNDVGECLRHVLSKKCQMGRLIKIMMLA